MKIFKPFGPSVCKVKMPNEMINNLNDYVDKIIKDKKRSKELDAWKKSSREM